MPFPSNVPSWHQYNSSSSAKYSALSCLFRLCLFSEQTQHLPCMCTDTHTMASYIWHFHTINRLKIRCGKSGVEFFSTPLVGNLLLLMGVNEFEFHNTNPMTQAEYSLGTMSHLCCYPKLVGTMRFWHWIDIDWWVLTMQNFEVSNKSSFLWSNLFIDTSTFAVDQPVLDNNKDDSLTKRIVRLCHRGA